MNSHKCSTTRCGNDAEFYAAWPGQPCKFCQPCLDRAKHIAVAMGFALPWARIPERRHEPPPDAFPPDHPCKGDLGTIPL